jgi:hypothetical protein
MHTWLVSAQRITGCASSLLALDIEKNSVYNNNFLYLKIAGQRHATRLLWLSRMRWRILRLEE